MVERIFIAVREGLGQWDVYVYEGIIDIEFVHLMTYRRPCDNF